MGGTPTPGWAQQQAGGALLACPWVWFLFKRTHFRLWSYFLVKSSCRNKKVLPVRYVWSPPWKLRRLHGQVPLPASLPPCLWAPADSSGMAVMDSAAVLGRGVGAQGQVCVQVRRGSSAGPCWRHTFRIIVSSHHLGPRGQRGGRLRL
jgi:hypothetical protein